MQIRIPTYPARTFTRPRRAHPQPAQPRSVLALPGRRSDPAGKPGRQPQDHPSAHRFQDGTGNLAAQPGRSNHQNGVAFDLNTGGFDGHPVYDFLKSRGPELGFIRTVNREHWHWEYRPGDAARLRAEGKFALSRVRV